MNSSKTPRVIELLVKCSGERMKLLITGSTGVEMIYIWALRNFKLICIGCHTQDQTFLQLLQGKVWTSFWNKFLILIAGPGEGILPTCMMQQTSILGDWVSSQSISTVTWNANFSNLMLSFADCQIVLKTFININNKQPSVIKSTSLSKIRSVCPDWVWFWTKL